MEKIVKLAGILIILLFIAIIAFSYLSSPPLDKVKAVESFIKVTKLYTDKKPIDLTKIQADSEDKKFIKSWAEYLKTVADTERFSNTQRRLAKQAITGQSLAETEGLQRGYVRIAAFKEANKQTNEALYGAVNDLVSNVKNLKQEETLFQIESFIIELENETAYFDKLNSYKVLVGQYFKAVLDFVKSREGYYQIDAGNITFVSPQDQDYYRRLYVEMQKNDSEIDRLSNEHRNEIRGELNEIFN